MEYPNERQTFLPHTRPDQAQPRPFPANISSYFRRPAKIVKSSSRDNSPRNLSRRRTTASHSTTRQRAASKGSISRWSGPDSGSNDATATIRPTSWHPNSMKATPVNDWTNIQQSSDSAYAMHFLTNPFATTEVNGLITPLTQPSSAESCYNEGFTPLDETQIQNLDSTYSFPSQAGFGTFWTPQHNFMPDDLAHQPPLYREMYGTDQKIPFAYTSTPDTYTGTAPPTPDFFAISNDAVLEKEKPLDTPHSEDEVLVGMGIYDGPSPPSSTALYGGHIVLPHRASAGKGLKLEETFQPTHEEGSDDEDDSNHEDAEEDGVDHQSVSAPSHQKYQPSESMGQPANTTLANQSFFFDNDIDEDQFLQPGYDDNFVAPVWTDVYSGAPCSWI